MNNSPKYEIYIKSPVIYGLRLALLDNEDLEEYYQAIIDAADSLSQWILFEHPQATAITSELNSQCILTQYARLHQHNCIGIALQLANVISPVVRHHQALNNLPIPFKASKNQIELSHFVEALANDIEHSQNTSQAVGS